MVVYIKKEIIKKRREHIEDLYTVYEHITFQANNGYRWTPKFDYHDFHFDHKFTPELHRSLLPCEIVFDLDSMDEEQVNEVMDLLNDLGISFQVGFSGRKGYHFHFFIKPKGSDLRDFCQAKDSTWFTKTLSYIILDHASDVLKDVDRQVLKNRKIRTFYSMHCKTGNVKMPFFPAPGRRHPRERKYKLSPEEDELLIPTWEVSKLFYKMALRYYREQKEREPQFYTDKPKSNFTWVKHILDHPEEWSDGRRRLMLYVLPPYVVNVKGMDVDEGYNLLEEWINSTPNGDNNNLKSLAKSELRAYRRSSVLPSRTEFNRILEVK